MKGLFLLSFFNFFLGNQFLDHTSNEIAPPIKSMSVLEFAPDGTLFIGDSRSGKVFAIDIDATPANPTEVPKINDLEGHIAGFLGTNASDILIHDMAVNPISKKIYFSVSRARSKWTSKWSLANDLSDATILLEIDNDGKITEVALEKVKFSEAQIPNPVGEKEEHKWKKGTSLRADAITDIAYKNGKLYVTGLSNEEFASSMWVLSYPFKEVAATTVEIYHGAHGAYETHAPIRTLLPYELNSKEHLIAAYLCTPLVTFEADQLENGKHIKGKTLAEFGAGNYPIDMLSYQFFDKELILMSNTQLPLMVIDPKDIAEYSGEIKEKVNAYATGVPYTAKAGTGIYHLANFNEKLIVATQRNNNGQLSLTTLRKERLRP